MSNLNFNILIVLVIVSITHIVTSENHQLTETERLNILQTSRDNSITLEIYRKKFNGELNETKNLIFENFEKLKNVFSKQSIGIDATNQQINEIQSSRTFGRIKRLQNMLIPVMFKLGVLFSIITAIFFLTLKSVLIGGLLLIINIVAIAVKIALAKAGSHHHHEGGGHKEVHLHIHNGGGDHHGHDIVHDHHSSYGSYGPYQQYAASRSDYLPEGIPTMSRPSYILPTQQIPNSGYSYKNIII